MNPISICAEHALRSHCHSALPLAELAKIVAARFDRGLDAARLRAVLEEDPERFRVLEPWTGPWHDARDGSTGAMRRRGPGAWAVAVGDPDDPPPGSGADLQLRESVRWLARGVDPRSGAEVARWYAILVSERLTRTAVLKLAA